MEIIIISAISAILLALSVLYAAKQIKLLRIQHEEDHDWNRRLAAQETLRGYHEIQVMVEAISEHFDYHNKTEGIPEKEFQEKFNGTKELQSRLHTVLNYFEGLARGIRQGIYDEEVIKASFRGHMIRVYESFKYYIGSRRITLHNPRIWIELEEMADKWKKEDKSILPQRIKTGVNS
ncbi:MAG: DUF4760 domain-containing protein [Methylococcales bacterium]|nr:DUF4760 domain-containing protein [Methylococcales bacterium]